MEEENAKWVTNCINSCTNRDQLKICDKMIELMISNMFKKGIEQEIIHSIENQLLETFLSKDSILIV
jgi:hypothetical protein